MKTFPLEILIMFIRKTKIYGICDVEILLCNKNSLCDNLPFVSDKLINAINNVQSHFILNAKLNKSYQQKVDSCYY